MKLNWLPRDLSNGIFVTSMVTGALFGILFAGWKIAGLPFVPFDGFDWLTRLLPGNFLGFGIGVIVHTVRALHLGPTADAAKTVEHVVAIVGLIFVGVAAGLILISILRIRRAAHPALLGLEIGFIMAVPAMHISAHASGTATVGPATRAVWILVVFLVWGVILGCIGRRLIGTETAYSSIENATERQVERIDGRHLLVKLGGSAAAITVVGASIGELAEDSRNNRQNSALAKAFDGQQYIHYRTQPLPSNPSLGHARNLRPLKTITALTSTRFPQN